MDTIGRLGGDEFIVLLEELSPDREKAAAMAQTIGEKVRAALEQPLHIEGNEGTYGFGFDAGDGKA